MLLIETSPLKPLIVLVAPNMLI